VDWLIEQGISADRMTALGYGESNLKNNCTDGIECTETQHERNRRVEFRVTDLGRAIDEMSLEH
jgi:outer membrane protein OmpA-like peptidoglycan-associated protein